MTKLQKSIIFTSVFTAGVAAFLLKIFLISLIILLCGIIIGCIKKTLGIRSALAILIIFFAARYYTEFRAPKPDVLYDFIGGKAETQGHVTTLPVSTSSPDTIKFEYKVFKIKNKKNGSWQKANAKTLLYIKEASNLSKHIEVGDTLTLNAMIKKPFQATNPGEFDYSAYLKNKRIFTAAFIDGNSVQSIQNPSLGWWWLLQKCNKVTEKIVSEHSKYLKAPLPELLSSIVFGKTAIDVSDNIIHDFTSSGLIHLLAASGLNVALTYGIWYFILRKLRAPFKFTIISGLILTLVYSVMTGLPPSIQRAELMLAFILIGKLFDRQADNLALISFVCALLLLIEPYDATDIGFQLSFAVTLGLILFMPVLTEKVTKICPQIPDYVSGAVLVPIVAQFWASPIIIYHFNYIAVYSVVANILVVPFIGILSFAGFLGSILSLIPVLGSPICFLTDKFLQPQLHLLLLISNYFASKAGAIKYLASPSIIGITLTYLLIFAILYQIKNNFSKKWWNIASVAIFSVLLCITFYKPHTNELKVMFFDVGEGDSMLITTPHNQNFLVDTGRRGFNGYSKAKNAIEPYLRKNGIQSLDGLVLTHPDSDHIGGALNILEDFKVKKVYNNGVKDHITKTYTSTINYIDKHHINYSEVKNGEVLYQENGLKITAFKVTEKHKHKKRKHKKHHHKHRHKKEKPFRLMNIDFELSVHDEDPELEHKKEEREKCKKIVATYADSILKDSMNEATQQEDQEEDRFLEATPTKELSDKQLTKAFIHDLNKAYDLEEKAAHKLLLKQERQHQKEQAKKEKEAKVAKEHKKTEISETNSEKHKHKHRHKHKHKHNKHKKNHKHRKHRHHRHRKDNESCIILLVEYKNTRLLLMSDAETSSFKQIEPSLPTKHINILKVGHHGSKKSLDDEMLDVLKPEEAIISVGKNHYGHPNSKILNLLNQDKIDTLRTDTNHAIEMISNGMAYNVFTFNPQNKRWIKKH